MPRLFIYYTQYGNIKACINWSGSWVETWTRLRSGEVVGLPYHTVWPSLNWGKPHEASQFSQVRCDLAETRAASGALVSQRNIDTIFLVRMSLHKPFNQLVWLEYSINVRFLWQGYWVVSSMCDLHYSHKLIMLNISILYECIDINMTYTYDHDGDQPTSLLSQSRTQEFETLLITLTFLHDK